MTTLDSKVLEIRDRLTFIPAIAIKVAPRSSFVLASPYWHLAERYLLDRAGYGDDGAVLLMRADGNGRLFADPYEWCDRTMQTAHLYIQDLWAFIDTGDVVDVEWILGETLEPKLSERVRPHDAPDDDVTPRPTHRTVKIRARPTRLSVCAPRTTIVRHPLDLSTVYAVRNVPMTVSNVAVMALLMAKSVTPVDYEIDYADIAPPAPPASPAGGEST